MRSRSDDDELDRMMMRVRMRGGELMQMIIRILPKMMTG
jgi:hypothetical protein